MMKTIYGFEIEDRDIVRLGSNEIKITADYLNGSREENGCTGEGTIEVINGEEIIVNAEF